MSKFLKPLTPGTGFSFNYVPSRIDRNALFAMNSVFDPDKVAQVRTKYHRARLNVTDLRADLLDYAIPKAKREVDDVYYAIFESVDRDMFGDCSVIPLTMDAMINHPDLPRQKSPGLPLKSQGFATKGDALQDHDVVRRIKDEWKAIERQEEVTLPDVACYARAQICSRDKNKVRATWGYPLSVYLAEGQFFYPLLDALKNKDKPKVAYGIEIGTGGMHFVNEMVSHFKGSNYLIGDWSKFDKTIPAWLIRDAFRMVARHIQFTLLQDENGDVKDLKCNLMKRKFERLIRYFIDTPIQLSTGERFIKHGGVPSGSCFTNLVDSIVNAIVTRYVIYQLTGALPLDDIYLGDDIVAITEEPLDLELFSQKAAESFSMKFNPDKSFQTSNADNVHFLGYFNLRGTPYKPVDTVIASAIYPERPVLTKFETVVRMVGQAYSCFEAEDAKRFFLAAQLLKNELEGLTDDMIEEFTISHSHWFKYLKTIGISTANGLKVPRVHQLDDVWLTAPLAPRRRWKYTQHDLNELAKVAFERWSTDESDVGEEEWNRGHGE